MNNRAAPKHPEDLIRWALFSGLGLMAGGLVAGLFAPAAFCFGYLSAFMFWWGLPLGAMAVLMLHHLVGGRWGAALRPALAALALTAGFFLPLFIPILLGAGWLYSWAAPQPEPSYLLEKKAAYLNVPFFVVRSLMVFAIWIGVAWLLFRSARHGRYAESRPGLASGGLILYFLTVTFAAIDWIGSLQYEWFSTVIGLYLATSQACTAFAVLILIFIWTDSARARPLGGVLGPSRTGQAPLSDSAEPNDYAMGGGHTTLTRTETLADLSSLMLAFVILHAYLAYAQYFITWNGNLPHEISWYLPRTSGIWRAWVVLMMVADFAIPLAALLSRRIKRDSAAMTAVCLVVLFARIMEAIWFVIPAYSGSQLAAFLFMLIALVAMGALWSVIFVRIWRRGPLLVAPALDGGPP